MVFSILIFDQNCHWQDQKHIWCVFLLNLPSVFSNWAISGNQGLLSFSQFLLQCLFLFLTSVSVFLLLFLGLSSFLIEPHLEIKHCFCFSDPWILLKFLQSRQPISDIYLKVKMTEYFHTKHFCHMNVSKTGSLCCQTRDGSPEFAKI